MPLLRPPMMKHATAPTVASLPPRLTLRLRLLLVRLQGLLLKGQMLLSPTPAAATLALQLQLWARQLAGLLLGERAAA
eukprot:7676497-Alexandrium_andersonii.AAC.1